MKLLYCRSCHDVFSLGYKLKQCSCQETGGLYTDELNAIYFGDALPMGLDSFSLDDAYDLFKTEEYAYINLFSLLENSPAGKFNKVPKGQIIAGQDL